MSIRLPLPKGVLMSVHAGELWELGDASPRLQVRRALARLAAEPPSSTTPWRPPRLLFVPSWLRIVSRAGIQNWLNNLLKHDPTQSVLQQRKGLRRQRLGKDGGRDKEYKVSCWREGGKSSPQINIPYTPKNQYQALRMSPGPDKVDQGVKYGLQTASGIKPGVKKLVSRPQSAASMSLLS